jgi:hypothetical protein
MTTQNEINLYKETVDYDFGMRARQCIDLQIYAYIEKVIKPVDEDITQWHELLDCDWDDNRHAVGIGGYRYKRLNNPDAESLTDEQFNTLCKMATVSDTLMDLYPE